VTVRRADIACRLVIALAVTVYAVRLDAPPWHAGEAPAYLFDESYTVFTAHRLLLGDAQILAPAERRYVTNWPGAGDLSPRSRGEWSHPPGAPLAIAAALAVFGFGAVAARLAAVIAALIALVATAQLAGPRRAWLACALVGFDGAFFVFARTAMPHMFLTAGLTAGAALLVGAAASPRPGRRLGRVAAAGAALGFAASVRWTAVPVAIALVAATAASREGRRHRLHRRLPIAAVAAVAVYLASYLPWLTHGHGIADLIELHRAMLAFHTAMPADAAQSTPAALWPWTLRAVTFAVERSGDEVRAVLCSGGRILWWGLPVALIAAAWRARRGALRWLMPAAAIAATWMPWAVIGRFGMTYYLLPALPFTAVVIARAVASLRIRGACPACAAVALVVFAVTYPVLAAVPISRASFARYAAVVARP
jgi:dolichyl-phosphate-mannose-protein mannosyltransferase